MSWDYHIKMLNDIVNTSLNLFTINYKLLSDIKEGNHIF